MKNMNLLCLWLSLPLPLPLGQAVTVTIIATVNCDKFIILSKHDKKQFNYIFDLNLL